MHPLVPHESAARAGLACVGGVYLVALICGRRLERAAAVMLIVQLIVDNAFHSYRREAFQAASAAMDGLVLLALTAAMLASQRRWLIWAGAYQLLAFCSDVLKVLDPTVAGVPYLTASIGFGYGVTGALAAGVWDARRPTRRSSAAA